MNNFLNDFIASRPTSQRRMAQAILKEATGDKKNIDQLANTIARSSKNRDLITAKEDQFGRIGASKLSGSFSNIERNIEELFQNSNRITSLLASIEEVLSSELISLDKDIDLVEKAIKNYAFLLADGLAFDYAFLEPFSNTNYFDTSDMLIPDRDNSFFSREEYADINYSDGSLTVAGSDVKNYPGKAHMVAQNFPNKVIGGYDNRTDNFQPMDMEWQVTVSSDTPLASKLKLFTDFFSEDFTGALMAVDYTIDQPAPCNSITIDPMASGDFEVLQCVVYYADEDSTTKELLSEPVSLDSTKTFYFPIKPVSRIRCFYRKSSYVRKYGDIAHTQSAFNQLFNKDDIGRVITSQKILNLTSTLQSLSMGTAQSNAAPKFSFDRYDDDTVRPGAHETMRLESLGFRGGEVPSAFLDVAARRFNTEDDKIVNVDKNGVAISGTSTYTPEKIGARVHTNTTSSTVPPQTKTYKYEYNFGVKSVRIGISNQKAAGVYVSQKLPSPGDIGEIRLSSAEAHSYDSALDNTLLTSVEYSVSNVSKPEKESDWIPILPAGTTSVLSERMLFDEYGRAIFRFKASHNDNIVIYKNGNIIDITPFGKLLLDSGSNIIGVQIDTQFYTSRDIFTCYYSPIGDPTTVNFEASGFATPPLASATDKDGPGEGFLASQRLSISLKNFPYIDYARASSATYSQTYGMSGYSPISIRFEDGTSAINLTNYASPVNQAPLVADSDSITFIHNKNVIMFNREVNSKMRVYYQHLPANTRVRVVIRSNSSKLVTPKIDYYQIKSKTRFPNSSSSL